MKLNRFAVLCLAAAAAAHAHFLFILPLTGDETAEMILSETLTSEDTVNPAIAAGARLSLRDAEGKVTEVKMAQDGHRFVMRLPGSGDRVIHGVANLGVAQRGKDAKPHLLMYYTKTILGTPFRPSATVSGDQVVEFVPKGQPGEVRLQMLALGKPLADSEVTVILPGGKTQKAKTNAEGLVGPFTENGRYGAWGRFWEEKGGEEAGKSYIQTRHYAMIVFDSYARPTAVQSLPEKTSSFGAVAENGWLYVYGGHTARTHSYSTEAVSGRFSRKRIDGGEWESLPAGMPLQGLNLAAHEGKVCRAGGMHPLNAPGAKADNHSVADVACFVSSSGEWTSLPPLPAPRSSHDVAVIGGKLIVAGGWNMRGAEPSQWAKSTLILDLRNPSGGWREVPQPFERRALVTAVLDGRLYVIGGITPSSKVSTEVDIFDPASNAWSKGPALPGRELNGFAPAAAVLDGKLYASVGDGSLFVLDSARQQWSRAGQSAQRLAHRMVPAGDSLVILGGAVKGANLDLAEKVLVP